MGEVYRARDLRLDREVAIKVLPAAVSQDSERLVRFEREAKALASLNHPHIAQIYGFEESDGVRALVMEFVPGSTLKTPLAMDRAIDYARQIAEALEAAHERGITHRDLKPANIMITPDGLVKVLDFGLAAVPPRTDATNPADSPTLTIASTQAGVILGTAGYMSPEQAAGKAVDKRADIWSFGVVLWELLTGERLFHGETVSHTLADVLRAPIPYEKLPEQTPRAIRELLARCLNRDVRGRLRDIGDARIVIEEALSNPEKQPAPAVSTKQSFVPWILASVLAIALASLALLYFRRPEPDKAVVITDLLPPDGTDYSFEDGFPLPALSPDGTKIVFGAKIKGGVSQLWLRRLDLSTAQPLPGTERAVFPFWAPESRWVGFGQGGTLKKVDTQGGAPIAITSIDGLFRGGTWNPEGVIVFGTNSVRSATRVSASGGAAMPVTAADQADDTGSHVYPWFLPDGRHFLYTNQQAGDLPVRVGSIDEPDKPGKVVAKAHSNAVYANGHLLYLREGALVAQPFDTDKLKTTGEAITVAEGVPTFPQPSRGAGFTVSRNGYLAYLVGGGSASSKLVWKDRKGNSLSTIHAFSGLLADTSLSPDGARVAISVRERSGKGSLYVVDSAKGNPNKLTFDLRFKWTPIWSPDGKNIYYLSAANQGKTEIFRNSSNEASADELVLSDPALWVIYDISPDGKTLLYGRLMEGKNRPTLWMLPVDSRQPVPLPAQPNTPTSMRISPDGHWVAYSYSEPGLRNVYVSPFPSFAGRRQISLSEGRLPRWRRDGKELYYVTPDSQMMAAKVTLGKDTLEVEGVQKLFSGATQITATYDVSPDGQKFVVVEPGESLSSTLTIMQNWPAFLRK
jgi:serine/threonine protein kinase/Tol biopolymer transport system component